MGRRAKPGEEDYDLVDAMKVDVYTTQGWCCAKGRPHGPGRGAG
jgi:hypothetical protein